MGGYALLFSDISAPDIQGDYFTAATETLWDGQERRPALYHHGLDATLNGRLLGNGWAKARIDDVGLWVETQLNLRDQYENAIYNLIKAGKLGLSSGTAAHMVQRAPDGQLTRWPVVEISFTPTPAEPRTSVAPIKSISLKTLREVKAMNLMELLKKLVPGLSEDQCNQIEAVLTLSGMAAPAEVLPEDDMIKALTTALNAAGITAPVEQEVIPTPVGVNRNARRAPTSMSRNPHARGGEPESRPIQHPA